MSKYWDSRQLDTINILSTVTTSEIEEELIKLYKQAFKVVSADMENLYNRIKDTSDGNKVIATDLYSYNRYFRLLKSINAELKELGEKEEQLLNTKFEEYALQVGKVIENQYNFPAKVSREDAEAVVKRVWANDGLHYSDRVWRDKAVLMNNLTSGLFQVVNTGKSVDALAKEVADLMQVDIAKAKRLVRTEISYIQNQTALERYLKAGLKQYKYLTMRDDKVCEHCKAIDQKVYDINKAKVGENLPPMHPNCRCAISPVVII